MSPEPLRISAAPDASGELVEWQAGVYGLRAVTGSSGAYGPLLDVALKAMEDPGGRALHVRLDTATRSLDAVPALLARGFVRLSERIEYEAEVARLPGELGSPLTWATLPDLEGDCLREASSLLERAGEGDPDWGEDDDALGLLAGYLADPTLTGGPESVAVGYLDDQRAAIVIAQVHLATGTGRLTYLGVLPAFRGRGLGAWVHRHGFAMLAAQGGKLYRGGTIVTNRPMQRLFERHGCAEWRRLEEWVWRSS